MLVSLHYCTCSVPVTDSTVKSDKTAGFFIMSKRVQVNLTDSNGAHTLRGGSSMDSQPTVVNYAFRRYTYTRVCVNLMNVAVGEMV